MIREPPINVAENRESLFLMNLQRQENLLSPALSSIPRPRDGGEGEMTSDVGLRG